jgi:nucleoside-diphosphate-sugar epimerase
MDTRPVLIVGCGDIGLRTARLLHERGRQVVALRRKVDTLPAFVTPIAADITRPDTLAPLSDQSFSQVLITTAAGRFSQERYTAVYVDGLANVLERLQAQAPQRIILASSTSVYHQNDGSRVDENSATRPESFSGRLQLQAEVLLQKSALATTVVRFGGIYGPGRDRLLQRLRQGTIVPRSASQYSNRIHSADCAAVLLHLLSADWRGESLQRCYLAVDSAPTPLREVSEWLAQTMGLDVAAMVQDVAPRRGGNKYCSNQRLLDSGYRFIYPDYRRGFSALLAGVDGPVNPAP